MAFLTTVSSVLISLPHEISSDMLLRMMPLKFSKQIYRSGYKVELLVLKKKRDQFHIIGIMRRLADFYLNKAPTLDEMKKAHRKFIRDYNTQIHFAHRERNDNRHSPQDVLRGVLARTLPAPTLARIFFATEFTRRLDRSGYIRFRRWRFYAEEGLAKQQVQISIYTSTRHRSNIRTQNWRISHDGVG